MELSNFPHCCGMKIVHNFDDDYIRGEKLTRYDKDSLTEYLEDELLHQTESGMMIAAINSQQREDGIAGVLKEVGFKDLTGEFFHPGHGRWISLWGYEFHPHKRKKPVVKKPISKAKFAMRKK